MGNKNKNKNKNNVLLNCKVIIAIVMLREGRDDVSRQCFGGDPEIVCVRHLPVRFDCNPH